MRDESRLDEALKYSRRQMEKLIETGKTMGSYIDLIRKSTELIEEVK
jgi:hypothetical protein